MTKWIRTQYYNLSSLKSLEQKLLTRERKEGPVVSLTSVPQRLPLMKPTLVSLLRQTLTPKEIRINLGKDYFKGHELPDFLKDLEIIKVHWAEKDMGPATKYLPTLQDYQGTDQLIIVVDDDMYYAPRLLEDLISADRQSSGRHSHCINGFLVPRSLESSSIGSDKALKSGIRRVAVIEGCGGYTLRPGHVDLASLTDLNGAPARSFFDDDIWLSGHLSRRGIEKYQVATGKRKSLINTVETAISGDRKQLQTDVMKFYARDWKDEEFEG